MAFSVGTNSLVSVLEVKEYWSDRDIVFSSYSDEKIKSSLIKATDFFQQRYGNDLVGEPTGILSFPRNNLYSGLVPEEVKKVVFDFSYIAMTSSLSFSPEVIKRKLEKVGPITEETEFDTSFSSQQNGSYPTQDSLMSRFLTSLRNKVIR